MCVCVCVCVCVCEINFHREHQIIMFGISRRVWVQNPSPVLIPESIKRSRFSLLEGGADVRVSQERSIMR